MPQKLQIAAEYPDTTYIFTIYSILLHLFFDAGF